MNAPAGAPAHSADQRRLRVLVNLSWLVPGVVGGSEESTTDAIRAVLEHEPRMELVLAARPELAAAHPDLAGGCRLIEMPGPFARSGSGVPGKVLRVVSEQTWLPRLAHAVAPDVVHHAGGVLPLVHRGATVLTIHDLQPLDLPGNFPVAKRWYLRAMLGRSARAADVVCVPSDFTAGRVSERLGVDRDAIRVVPWTVVSRQAPGSTAGVDPDTWSGEQGPLFLYPAVTHPHKNHLVLLDAFAAVLEELPDALLVLPGAPGSAEPEVTRRMREPDLGGRAVRPGRLSGASMDALYRRSAAVVVPSRYEGFGLPALEAMRAGVPLLVADAGSLPEVVGDGGAPAAAHEPLDPDDPAAWAAAMVSVARLGASRRHEVVARQHAAAARFDARSTARALAGAYRDAASAHLTSRS